jgi:hypothetical protein
MSDAIMAVRRIVKEYPNEVCASFRIFRLHIFFNRTVHGRLAKYKAVWSDLLITVVLYDTVQGIVMVLGCLYLASKG